MIGGAAGETNGNNRELTIIGVPGKTVIKSSNSWAINANGNNLTVNIEGVTFEGNGSNMAIQDQYHDRYTGMTFKINNCTFKNYGYAVQLIHAGEGSYVTNCTFENNTVGVSIGAADGTVVLSGNTYKGNSKADITYFGTDTEIARVDVQDKAAKVEKDG